MEDFSRKFEASSSTDIGQNFLKDRKDNEICEIEINVFFICKNNLVIFSFSIFYILFGNKIRKGSMCLILSHQTLFT